MIDTNSEEVITLRQARHEFPNKPSLATLWRWLLKGVRGAVLESVKIGGRRYTSREACQRFIQASSEKTSKPRQPSKREQYQSFRRAQTILDHYGV